MQYKRNLQSVIQITIISGLDHESFHIFIRQLSIWSSTKFLMNSIIRRLVEEALYIKKLTPTIENELNYELTRLGHISEADFEALELLMAEMDAGRIQLVPTP